MHCCREWKQDDEKEEYFFAVSDIVEVLTESKDVKQYIKRMRSRDPELNVKWGTIVPLFECWPPTDKSGKAVN